MFTHKLPSLGNPTIQASPPSHDILSLYHYTTHSTHTTPSQWQLRGSTVSEDHSWMFQSTKRRIMLYRQPNSSKRQRVWRRYLVLKLLSPWHGREIVANRDRCPWISCFQRRQEWYARQHQGTWKRWLNWAVTDLRTKKVRDRQLAAPAESETIQELVLNELKSKKHVATEGLLWLVR